MNWDAQDNGDECNHFGHWNAPPLLSPSLSSHRQYFWMQIKPSQLDLPNVMWLCFACQIQHPFMSMHKWVMIGKGSNWTEQVWCDLSVVGKLQPSSIFLYILLFLSDFNVRWNNKLDGFSFYLAVIQFLISFPNSWRSLPIYVTLTNALSMSFPMLRGADLSPWNFRTPMFAAGLVMHWHSFQHSIWHGTASNRQNIEQHDRVCKGFCNVTGYRQPHWWANPISCKSELFYGAVPIYSRWELLLILLMY